jgi:hypothetical protein
LTSAFAADFRRINQVECKKEAVLIVALLFEQLFFSKRGALNSAISRAWDRYGSPKATSPLLSKRCGA